MRRETHLRPFKLAKFAPPTIIANYVQIRMHMRIILTTERTCAVVVRTYLHIICNYDRRSELR